MPLPHLLLLGGLLIAGFVTTTIFLWRTSGGRLVQIRTLNAELQGHVAERTQRLEASEQQFRQLAEDYKRAEGVVGALNATLELRVAQRTAELGSATSQLEGVLERLQTDSERLALATRAANLGIWDWDVVHDSLLWDDGMYELYGVVRGQFGVAYEAWVGGLHPDDMPRMREEIQLALRGEKEYDTEFRVLWPDQSVHHIQANASVLRDESGQAVRMLGTNRDISGRKRAEADLVNARDIAESATRAKSEFLATMSHEIRTPMNGVVGMTELLLLTDLSHEQRGYAEIVSKSAESLLTVINDILDFSKIESGQMSLETIAFAPRTALEEAVDLLAERAQSKGLEMACLIPHDLPLAVRGDPGRLRQIVTNLLGNAIKFTQAGEVVLRAKLVGESHDEVTIRLEVADTGIGIAHEGRSRLFESFSQADASTTRKFGGTGLGLAISKRLTTLMGGEIGVESEPGHGSTFWFTVRLGKIPADQAVVHTSLEDLRGLRALAVDDNETNLLLVRTQTQAWGMECDVATHASDALQMIDAASRRRPYDIALLDLQMPGIDGLELARAIKREPSNEKIKLILMTSMAQRGQAATSEHAGIAAYLTKPVRQAQLRDCLRTVMGTSSQASPPRARPQIVTVHSLKETTDGRRPRVLLAEDNQTNQMAAVRMMERLGYRVDVAVNGLQAVEACRNVDYGVVLMDNQMPEMDGLTAARLIRTGELTQGKPPVPIIALTANAMQGDREKCVDAGMNDYLSKPFKVAQLREVLERWGPPLLPAADADPPAAEEHAIDSRVFDGLRDEGPGGNDFVIRLIDQYLADSTTRMAALKDAVARQDAAGLEQVAHSLFGSSHVVGANRMAAICEVLETLARNATLDSMPTLMVALEHEFTRVREALHIEQGAEP